jgi:hypothetical protein
MEVLIWMDSFASEVALVNTVMKLQVPYDVRNLLNIWGYKLLKNFTPVLVLDFHS